MKGMIDASSARQWFMHLPHAVIGMGSNSEVQSAPPSDKATAEQKTRLLRVSVLAGWETTWETAAERLVRHLNANPELIARRDWGEGNSHALPCRPPVSAEADGMAERACYFAEEVDCLVLLGWPEANDRQRLKQIELYCRGGGPLVAVRTLDARMPAWPDFAEEVFGGRQPAPRRSRLLEVLRSDVAWHHPVVEGVEILIAEGEVYRGPRLSPRATVLLTADDGRGPAPAAWALRRTGSRVFCTTLGHEDDFHEPAFLRLVSNAVRWTASVQRPA
jgi:hypothetical protein